MKKENHTALPTTRVRLSEKGPIFSPQIASALIFVSFFALGCVVYTQLAPAFSQLSYLPADRRLSLFYAVPTTAEGALSVLFYATAEDGVFFSLIFLFSFSFFTPFLVNTLLALRALRLSFLLCRLHDLARLGALTPVFFFGLVAFEAVVCTLAIFFSARARALSQSLRTNDRYQALPVFTLLFFHLLRLIFAYFAVLFSAGVLYLAIRL